MTASSVTEGYVDFDATEAGKPCKTWYKIVGDLSCGITPLVVLHGGPGLSHHYVLPMTDLNIKFGMPVIFYDQIGNGLSTHLPEKLGDGSFWVDSLFHAELTNLVSKLSLSSYDVLGHSWGGMMGSTFAGNQPEGLRRLVLSNAPATFKGYEDAYNEYRKDLPQEVQDTLSKHEEAGTLLDPEYAQMMAVFNKKHFCTISPYPLHCQMSFEWEAKDNTVGMTMVGLSEWNCTGSGADWTAIPVIKNIIVPTLVLNGVNEGASDKAIAPFVDGIPDVTWVKLSNSTHMPHWEEREHYMQVIGEWLTVV